jgi:hypothetical protein
MSIEKNVQIVKNFLAALNGRDKQGLLALSAEDIEWIVPGEDWPLAGTHSGHAALENLLQRANENGGNFLPRASRVHRAGRPGPGRRLRYGENQSHKQDV